MTMYSQDHRELDITLPQNVVSVPLKLSEWLSSTATCHEVQNTTSMITRAWAHDPSFVFTAWQLNCSEPEFPHLENMGTDGTDFTGWMRELNKAITRKLTVM